MKLLHAGAALVLGAAMAAAFAEPAAAPSGVLNLTASAQVEVPRDLLAVTFTTSRDGADASAVQAALKQALEAALAEAKRAARPGGAVDVRTGNFALYPRLGPKGQPAGWQGSAELVVEGRDMAAIGQLAGRISTMTVGRVAQSLSREARAQVEGDVAAQAIQAFRAKAASQVEQFGYVGYTVREVTVNANDVRGFEAPMLRARAAAAPDEALPIEAGRAVVGVTVSGSVQMTR